MQFIANYDAKNVFGCFENVEQHALAFSEEAAAKLFDSGMKIFRGDAVGVTRTGGKTMLYSEIIRSIDEILSYFKFHNKNLTNTQIEKLYELQDLIHELRITQERNK